MVHNVFEYDVCLSFAGEERAFVEEVANFLKANAVRVFYDAYEEVSLWGKDLVIHLDDVYRNRSRYCVVFVSKNYASKIWPVHELKSAFARAVRESQEYILPVRFDGTELPGLRDTVKYISAAYVTPRQVGQLILRKLSGEELLGATTGLSQEVNPSGTYGK